MTDDGKPVSKRKKSAKEHLAGIKAAQAWQQDLQAAGLLRTQAPIRDTPITGGGESPSLAATTPSQATTATS
jgi:hypothetical protein